jgi:hypothetical protein
MITEVVTSCSLLQLAAGVKVYSFLYFVRLTAFSERNGQFRIEDTLLCSAFTNTKDEPRKKKKQFCA